jgi:hypothetical protein
MSEAQRKLLFIGVMFLTLGAGFIYAAIVAGIPNATAQKSFMFVAGSLGVGTGIGFVMLRHWALKLMITFWLLLAAGLLVSHFFLSPLPTDIALIALVLYVLMFAVSVLFYRKYSKELT